MKERTKVSYSIFLLFVVTIIMIFMIWASGIFSFSLNYNEDQSSSEYDFNETLKEEILSKVSEGEIVKVTEWFQERTTNFERSYICSLFERNELKIVEILDDKVVLQYLPDKYIAENKINEPCSKDFVFQMSFERFISMTDAIQNNQLSSSWY